MRAMAAFTLVAFFCAASAHAQPAPESDEMALAKQHFEAGQRAFQTGDYHAAIREFKEAQQLRPSPLLDYNIGLAHEQLGHRRVAVKFYQRYLQGMPIAPNRAEVEAQIAELERQSASAPPEQPVPGEESLPPPTPSPTAQPQPDARAQPQAQPQPQAEGQPAQAQAQQAQPQQAKPRSLWWVPLVVVGGVVLITAIILTAIFVSDSGGGGATFNALQSQPSRAPLVEPATVTLFRF